MDKLLKKYLDGRLELTVFGLEQREHMEEPYGATPRGARVFAWTGVDGIHYCTVRGFGDRIFAVEPMDGFPDGVRSVARSFTDFLRLLLACGSESAIQQAHRFTQEEFDRFLAENPPRPGAAEALTAATGLAPMEEPYTYIDMIQWDDLPYRLHPTDPELEEDFSPAGPGEEPWAVCPVDHRTGEKSQPGREVPLGKTVLWAGYRWLIPAIYNCTDSFVLDICMEIPREQLEISDTESHRGPVFPELTPVLYADGIPVKMSSGSGNLWDPLSEHRSGESWVLHYGLDRSCGWLLQRFSFPFPGEKDVRTLALTMNQDPISVEGPVFTARRPGDSLDFVYPPTGETHTLTLREIEEHTADPAIFRQPELDMPTHTLAIVCTVEPPLEENRLTLHDMDPGDPPRRKDGHPSGSIGCGISMVALCPKAMEIQGKTLSCVSAASSSHFAPVSSADFRLLFHVDGAEPVTLTLR